MSTTTLLNHGFEQNDLARLRQIKNNLEDDVESSCTENQDILEAPIIYKPRLGETFHSIGKKFGISKASLQALNSMKELTPEIIMTRKYLVVPSFEDSALAEKVFNAPEDTLQTLYLVYNLSLLLQIEYYEAQNVLNRANFDMLPPPLEPYVLQFVFVNGSKVTNPCLFTNYSPQYQRDRFTRLDFVQQGRSDYVCHMQIEIPGCFEFHVRHDNGNSESGSFVVDPLLRISNDVLPLDGINILTIIPKWMPSITNWPAFFQSFQDTGYNMVHFAPVNSRGSSNSPYAIYDQLSISDDLFNDPNLSESDKEVQLVSSIRNIQQQNKILSVTDIVWNHTACNSLWLQAHPEAGYNLITAPHLQSAFDLDEAILDFSNDIASMDIDTSVMTKEKLEHLMILFEKNVLVGLNLWQYYVMDVAPQVAKFREVWSKRDPSVNLIKIQSACGQNSLKEQALELKNYAFTDPLTYKRFSKTMDVAKSVEFMNSFVHNCGLEGFENQIAAYQVFLDEINLPFYLEWDNDRESILSQIANRAQFLRIAEHGPKLGDINRNSPLVDPYFTRLPRNTLTQHRDAGELALANNGWIWNADPLQNFASSESKAYLRREVIPWGDCVKLRYGDCYDDNPWLWDHQLQYTLKMASIFHGFRIDNCHSTPIHVASYFLDKARKLNPNLYVIAELFTGSEEKDIFFVSKLGINSLIREAMNAWDPTELSRLCHERGGVPVGGLNLSVENLPPEILGYKPVSKGENMIKREYTVNIKGSRPHSLFMDCTHDNETPHQKRTADDTLSNAAVVAMSVCAIGSVKGYDEIVPELLNVVSETRKYRLPRKADGIIPAKTELLLLHKKLAEEGYSEINVNQEHDFISIHRTHPITHAGYLLITRCAFKNKSEILHSPIRLHNQRVKVYQSATLKVKSLVGHACMPYERKSISDSYHELFPKAPPEEPVIPQSPVQFYHALDEELEYDSYDQHYCGSEGCIRGLPCTLEHSTTQSRLTHAELQSLDNGQFETLITIDPQFEPGSIVIYQTFSEGLGNHIEIDKFSAEVADLKLGTSQQFFELLWKGLGIDDPSVVIKMMLQLGQESIYSAAPWFLDLIPPPPNLIQAVSILSPVEINMLLYRSYREELDTFQDSVYDIPGYGGLAYCGLQGLVSLLIPLAKDNALGHPLFQNLRNGHWLIDYTLKRLAKIAALFPKARAVYEWIRYIFDLLKRLSPAHIPKYFTISVLCAYEGIKYRALQLNNFQFKDKILSSTDLFALKCTLATFQFHGSVSSAGLIPKSYPDSIYPENSIPDIPQNWNMPSLSAGLPHFSVDYMRLWGRDVFISIQGCFIIQGRFDDARAHIIAFGSTLRHGLIPNLLDQGRKPRYNSRDAVWFWLAAVAAFCRNCPEGYDFLGHVVHRRFIPLPQYTKNNQFDKDADTFISVEDKRAYLYSNTIAELCHEILERHANGISFVEYNAGAGLDHAMTMPGFLISIETLWNQGGIISGGNRWNCGTWMDKMGDSKSAGTFGTPATPRDGSAIEINGLLKAALKFVNNEASKKAAKWWPWDKVDRGPGKIHVTYKDWENMLQENFERNFYIPITPEKDKDYNIERKELINRRGIYKDTFGSSVAFCDFQLRPNLCIAMSVAPELFNPDHARICLEMVKKILVGPIGIKTLDPSDWAYRGVYDNGNDSTDPHTAHGFNYHQGPVYFNNPGMGMDHGIFLESIQPFCRFQVCDAIFAESQKVN